MIYRVSIIAWNERRAGIVKMKLHTFLRDEEALTIVEYAVAGGLIVAALAAALLALGLSINTIMTSINAFLTP